MYGLVNKAIEQMISTRFGEETWQEIKEIAEIQVERFVAMEAYPDDVTHRLVMAASGKLGLTPAEVLRAFGEYWVLYTAEEGYGPLLQMAGQTLPEFLQHLDSLHARVGVSFPKLRPPSFDCDEVDAEQLELHYHSSRQGLAPMVVGLIEGLGTRFDQEVEVTHHESREAGADHDIFTIRYHPQE